MNLTQRIHDASAHRKVLVMGILNVTPDSFSDGGRFDRLDAALAHAQEMVEQGADILDIGGESTRPGAAPDRGAARRETPGGGARCGRCRC